MKDSTTTEVMLCDNCDGRGKWKTEKLTDYHKREYDTVILDCKQCNNTGRLLVTTVTTVEPFKERP